MAGFERFVLATSVLFTAARVGGVPIQSLRPPWADALVYEGIQDKRIFISRFEQNIQLLPRKYYWSDARLRCNARIVEEVEFDFRPRTEELVSRDYERNIRPQDRVPFVGGAVRQYYMYPEDMRLEVEDIQLVNGANRLPHWRAEEVDRGELLNKTFEVRFNFTPASRDVVTIRIILFAWNFLESRTDYNLIFWRPYGPIWEGPRGAFVANATFNVHIPVGRNALKGHPIPDRVPEGKGFNIYTNLRKPLPTETWSDDAVLVRLSYDLWASQWDPPENGFSGQGHEPLRVDLLFDRQIDRCNAYPYWLYLVSFGAALTFIFFSLSIVGFCYFERPWEMFADLDVFAGRKRLLDKLRRERDEQQRQEQAMTGVIPTQNL